MSEEQLTLYTWKSRYNQPCEECGKGIYEETCIYDDWYGTLHCNLCNHEVSRRYKVWGDT